MIREAVAEDIPDILIMGQKFYNLAGWSDVAPWNAVSVMGTLERMTGSQEAVLLVIENETGVCGMVGAVIYPFYCNNAYLMAQEMFFWVEPGARGNDAAELFDKLEEDAKAKGARIMIMISVEGLRASALARLYRRRGYKAAENSFIKAL